MASLVRIGVSRLSNGTKSVLLAKSEINFARSITSKSQRCKDTDRPVKPKPWDYSKKSYTILNYWTDRTTSRLDENSKFVIVEGPVAAGKTEFAKTLAEELDMVYFPEANLDMVYINHYGYDLRKLDDQIPESCRSFDIKDFLKNPKHYHAIGFQILQYRTKFTQYVDALAHLLSTGQGVVLDRSAYSDFVFVEAMRSQGYLSKLAYDAYYDTRSNTITEILKPHLVIYLDVPVDKVQENIKKRNLACERNSQVLTPAYLSVMEKSYKQKYLKDIARDTELLIYDWSDGGDVEIVVEDIERIDFDHFDTQDVKLKDWRDHTEEDWGEMRNRFSDRKDELMANFNVPYYTVPELLISGEDAKTYSDIVENAPGERYETGFNSEMGDSIFLRTSGLHRETLPRRERVLE